MHACYLVDFIDTQFLGWNLTCSIVYIKDIAIKIFVYNSSIYMHGDCSEDSLCKTQQFKAGSIIIIALNEPL